MELDKGIREVVQRLNTAGFRTTDSGDGQSKVGTAMEGCMDPIPNVTIASTRKSVIGDTDALVQWVKEQGVRPEAARGPQPGDRDFGDDVIVEAVYRPLDDAVHIHLNGLDDALLAGCTVRRDLKAKHGVLLDLNERVWTFRQNVRGDRRYSLRELYHIVPIGTTVYQCRKPECRDGYPDVDSVIGFIEEGGIPNAELYWEDGVVRVPVVMSPERDTLQAALNFYVEKHLDLREASWPRTGLTLQRDHDGWLWR